jgi:hypothetical protein
MRRLASLILFLLAGWLLSGALMMASISIGSHESAAVRLGSVAVMSGLAALPLLLALIATPGNRFAELGVMLMIVAAVASGVVLTMVMVTRDPEFARLMPPGRSLPQLDFAPLWGSAALLLVGGGGYLLRRLIARAAKEPELERVFGRD